MITTLGGVPALELFSNHEAPIDLLLSDVILPGMSGPRLARKLLTSQPAARALLMSGYSNEDIETRGPPGDRVELLLKPFTPDELERKVRQVLG